MINRSREEDNNLLYNRTPAVNSVELCDDDNNIKKRRKLTLLFSNDKWWIFLNVFRVDLELSSSRCVGDNRGRNCA